MMKMFCDVCAKEIERETRYEVSGNILCPGQPAHLSIQACSGSCLLAALRKYVAAIAPAENWSGAADQSQD